MAGRRSTDSNPPQPALKVVGFRVEGVPASPAQAGLLLDSLGTGGGSPDPVIIPPSFQAEAGIHAAAGSPSRQHSVPSFISEDAEPHGMQDLLSPSVNVRTAELARPGLQRTLVATGSLPPLSEAAAADYRRFAASVARTSPHPSPRAQRTTQSQPASAQPTPPVSPYADADRRASASFRQQSALDLAQPAAAATFADRVSLRGLRADLGRLAPQPPAANPPRAEAGTPRQQHGFQVGARHPDATPAADTPASQAAEASPAPAPGAGAAAAGALPADPEVLTSPASQKAPAGAASAAEPPKEGRSKARGQAAREAADSQAGGEAPERKKAGTKAERRALQERQRAEKAAAKAAEADAKQRPAAGAAAAAATPRAAAPAGRAPGHAAAKGAAQQPAAQARGAQPPARTGGQTSQMFAHLPPFKAVSLASAFADGGLAGRVHPEVLRAGLRCADGSVSGGNARCLAMLLAFRALIQDYRTPESKELSRDLTQQLNTSIQFLVECRPLSVSMGTAIKALKLKVSHISAATPQEAARAALLEEVDTLVQEKLTFADEQVARTAQAKIAPGDVVLTFAFSAAVLRALLAARREGKAFRVVVADCRPHHEGRAMLGRLLAAGIPCTYLHLHALCFTMQEVTKVLLGATGALANGTVLARAGSAAVALAARAARRPVIVCCETLKFVDRVQLDSITHNELGDPDALATVAGRPDLAALAGWRALPQLDVLNLVYDAMPCEFVTMIVTEVGAIPPTSVPVVLREYRTAPRL